MAVLYSQRFSFQSGSGSSAWFFTVAVGTTGTILIIEIQSPTGSFTFDSNVPLPESVVEDMNTAIDLVKTGNIASSGATGTTGTTGFFVLIALFSLCGWYFWAECGTHLLSTLS